MTFSERGLFIKFFIIYEIILFFYLLIFCSFFEKSISKIFNNFITGFDDCFDIIIFSFYLI